MKKIIIFNAGSFIYGAERGLLNLVKTLSPRGEIIVILPRKGPLQNKLIDLHDNIRVKIFPLPIILNSISPFYYIGFMLHSMFNIVFFTFYILYHNIDTVYTNSLLIPFPGIVATLTKRKHIWHLREFFSCQSLNTLLGSFIRKFARVIICQSKTIARKLNLQDNAQIIYEPLDKYEYSPYDHLHLKETYHLPRDAIVVMIIARIHPLKGQYEFIKKIKDLLQEMNNVFVIMVGDISPITLRNHLYKKKIELFRERNHLENVLLWGFKEEIDKMLSLSDICVFPFRREEPFGIAVAEALAFGKPTFFPKVAGLKEVYQIFKKGEDFDAARVIHAIRTYTPTSSQQPQQLDIPETLSLQTYKNNVRALL